MSSTSLTPTPSPSDTSNQNNNFPTGVLGSTGGAPLILVFLGVGLLIGAIFALFILRRFYPRRRREAAARAFRRGEDARFDQKPLLWDVQLEIQEPHPEKGAYKDLVWNDMKPMSARFIPDKKIPPPAPLPIITLESIVADEPRTSHLSGLRRHLHLGRSDSPQSTESHSDASSFFESPTGGYTRNGKLQVAVAIEMPRPRREAGRHCNRGTDSEFCLGLTEIPWDERAVAKSAT